MAACDVVIVGSYPPMPGPATEATLAAVRRAWDAGYTVRVVSYRLGAADRAVPVAGPLAGWRLEHVRRLYGEPPRLVLVAQAGAPFADLQPAQQMATAAGLALAFRRFTHSTLVLAEDPGAMPMCLRWLAGAATECAASSTSGPEQLYRKYRLPAGSLVVEEPEPYPAAPQAVEPSTWGLYRPGAGAALTVVEMPTTTLAQRAAARARSSRSVVLRRLRRR